jgi:hypothetical protein
MVIYDATLRHSGNVKVVIPPRSTAVAGKNVRRPGQRDRHIASIETDGRLKWQASTSYVKRALVETAMGRYKGIIGHRLRARPFSVQPTEVAIGCTVLNRMLSSARPNSVRCKAKAN